MASGRGGADGPVASGGYATGGALAGALLLALGEYAALVAYLRRRGVI